MRAPTLRTTINTMRKPTGPARIALTRYPRPYPVRTTGGRIKSQVRRALGSHVRGAFKPLIDAKAASTLLGVPYTWLLAQARAGAIPHHRLGHYVRFNPDDLEAWLKDTKIEARTGSRSYPHHR